MTTGLDKYKYISVREKLKKLSARKSTISDNNLKWKEKETHRQSSLKLTFDDFVFFYFILILLSLLFFFSILASVEIMASNSW